MFPVQSWEVYAIILYFQNRAVSLVFSLFCLVIVYYLSIYLAGRRLLSDPTGSIYGTKRSARHDYLERSEQLFLLQGYRELAAS